MQQTSDILRIVSATPRAIAELSFSSHKQAEQQSARIDTLHLGLEIVTSYMEKLSLDMTSLSAHARKHADSLKSASNRLIELTQNTKELLILYWTTLAFN